MAPFLVAIIGFRVSGKPSLRAKRGDLLLATLLARAYPLSRTRDRARLGARRWRHRTDSARLCARLLLCKSAR